MNKLFVIYELAKQLKEKGFDELCLAFYKSNGLNFDIVMGTYDETDFYGAPLYQQVVDWFRNNKQIDIIIMPVFREKCGYDSFKRDGYTFTILQIKPCQYLDYSHFNQCGEDRDEQEKGEEYLVPSFKTYYETLDKAIEEALKLI